MLCVLEFLRYFTQCENRGVVGTQVCPNHIHDMGKLIFIQFKIFIKKTKVLVKETK